MNKLVEYLNYIGLKDFKTYHYKTLLILLERPQTQAMIGTTLGVSKQNINKIVKRLEEEGYIEVDRLEGRNKFYRVVTDTEKLERAIKGQIRMEG